MRKLEGEEAAKVKQEKLWKTKEVCTGKGWQQDGDKKPCGEAFELTELDIQFRVHNFMGRGNDTYYGFTCPECGCFTELNESDIPSYVRNNAPQYEKPPASCSGTDNGDK